MSMRHYLKSFLFHISILITTQAYANCVENVCIASQKTPAGIELHAQNQASTTAVMEITADLKNLKASPTLPIRLEVPPFQKALVTTLEPIDARQGYSYAYQFNVHKLAPPAPCKGDVCIESSNTMLGIDLIAKNSTYGDVTMHLDAQLDNLKSNPALPLIKVLPARSQLTIAQLTREKMAHSQGFQLKIRHVIGNIYAHHDASTVYRLPFNPGSSHLVGQGFDGAFTHKGSNRFAIDFNMPIGTPVLAARAGTVVDIKSNGTAGCPEKRCEADGNYVRIQHADATIADYAHFKFQGVTVVTGQKVSTGQMLGYSGATGYASGPHLHFAVKKPISLDAWESIPIKFIATDGIISQPLEGQTYTATLP